MAPLGANIARSAVFSSSCGDALQYGTVHDRFMNPPIRKRFGVSPTLSFPPGRVLHLALLFLFFLRHSSCTRDTCFLCIHHAQVEQVRGKTAWVCSRDYSMTLGVDCFLIADVSFLFLSGPMGSCYYQVIELYLFFFFNYSFLSNFWRLLTLFRGCTLEQRNSAGIPYLSYRLTGITSSPYEYVGVCVCLLSEGRPTASSVVLCSCCWFIF